SIPQLLSQIAVGLKLANSRNAELNGISAFQYAFLFVDENNCSVLENGINKLSFIYSAGDVVAVERIVDPLTKAEDWKYYQNGELVYASSNLYGFNAYRLGINIASTSGSVSNIIMSLPSQEDVSAYIEEALLCAPT